MCDLARILKHPVYSDDGNSPVRGGTRQHKKTDGEVFGMWLENYITNDAIVANETNESRNEEYRDDNLEGQEQA